MRETNWNIRLFFKLKLKPKYFLLNRHPASCKICMITFESESKLKTHRNLEHPTDKKLQCAICGRPCISKSQLAKHMRAHQEPQFKCRFCEKKLKSEEALAAHECEHTGERPYKCTLCGNGYKSSSAISTHMKHVHKVLTPRMKPIEKRVRKNKDF